MTTLCPTTSLASRRGDRINFGPGQPYNCTTRIRFGDPPVLGRFNSVCGPEEHMTQMRMHVGGGGIWLFRQTTVNKTQAMIKVENYDRENGVRTWRPTTGAMAYIRMDEQLSSWPQQSTLANTYIMCEKSIKCSYEASKASSTTMSCRGGSFELVRMPSDAQGCDTQYYGCSSLCKSAPSVDLVMCVSSPHLVLPLSNRLLLFYTQCYASFE